MSNTVALLSKYPPLEGGIAAKTYWLAKGLASRGYKVHIITHATGAGRAYEIQDDNRHPTIEGNLWVHRPQYEMPWHIPEDQEQTLALLDLTIKVIREHGVQILDTGYLLPYGIIGHLAKLSTGVHHVMRHGGSDLEKFLKGGILGTVLKEAISKSDVVITDKWYRHTLESINPHIVCQPSYVPDGSAFKPNINREPRYRLAAIGKINYYWQHKGLHLVAEIMQKLKEKFECWIVGQGNGISDFQRSLGSQTVSSIDWRPFVPPWKMPDLLHQLDGVFIFESGLPHSTTSNLALEALCSGLGIITDRSDFIERYKDLMSINRDRVLVVSPSEPSSAAEAIVRWIQDQAYPRQPSRQLVTYGGYLSSNEAVYAGILAQHRP